MLDGSEGLVASALIRGGSKQEVSRHIAMCLHMLAIHLEVRIWFDWIDSESNPADGLSRDGPKDVWTLQQAWETSEALPITFLPDESWLWSFFP